MSHVDEGELTAYADGAYAPDDPAALRIAAHLAECANCRNRLAQAQALSLRASEVLAIAAPLTVHTPPFDDIARVSSTRRRRFPAVPLTWAATVILALGIGWFGRASVTPVTRTVQAPAEDVAPVVTGSAAPAAATEERQTAQAQPQRETRMRAREFDAQTAARLSVEVAGDQVAAPPPPPAASVAAAPAAEAEAKAFSAGLGAVAGNAVRTFPMIPDLEIVSVRTVGDSLHVQQKLPDGVVVTVMSRLGPASAEEGAKALRAESAMMDAAARKQTQGPRTFQFRVYGPLSEDSLRALLSRVR